MLERSHKDQLLQYGQEYISRGWRVAWCYVVADDTGKKRPTFEKSWQSHNAATSQELTDQYKQFVSKVGRNPNTLAILTGPTSNLFVLDLDNPLQEAKKFLKDYGIEIQRDSYSVLTQSGGIQIYYAYDSDLDSVVTTRSKLTLPDGSKAPVDVRGAGGLVFAPPSRVFCKGTDDPKNAYRYYKLLNGDKLNAVPVQLKTFLLAQNRMVTNESALQAQPHLEVSQIPAKIVEKFENLVNAAKDADKGKRSEADYRAIIYGVVNRFPPEYIHGHLMSGGKCLELKKKKNLRTAEQYYQHTLRKAKAYISSKPLLHARAGLDTDISGAPRTTVDVAGDKIDLIYYRWWTVTRNPISGNVMSAKLDPSAYLDWLKLNGFSKHGNQYLRIKDRVGKIYELTELKQLTHEYVTALRDAKEKIVAPEVCDMLRNDLATNKLFFFNSNILLGATRCGELRDTESVIYLPFKNVCLKITSDDIGVVQYRDLPDNSYIMANDIIDHYYVEPDKEEAEFSKFAKLITSFENTEKAIKRLRAYEGSVGYLISRYKTPAECPAIVYSDELMPGETPDRPQGGRGKGTTLRAIGLLRKVSTIPSHSFERNNRFAWQGVHGTRVILLDDIPRNFKIDSIFSEITEGITIDRKYKIPVHIPFNDCPKFAITTNYSIKTPGVSALRRIHEVELSAYFGYRRNIRDEFGHNFFDDWSETEWHRFYGYMAHCCRWYLHAGLTRGTSSSITKKRLINETGEEFVSWFDEQISLGKINMRRWYSVSQIREEVVLADPDLDSRNFELSHHRLRMWLEQYCQARGYHIMFGRKRINGSTNALGAFIFSDEPLIEDKQYDAGENKDSLNINRVLFPREGE